MEGRGFLPIPGVRARGQRFSFVRGRVGIWTSFAGLYLLAAALLLLPWPFGAHPPWAYNWEGYTAWRWNEHWAQPDGWAISILAPTDGLMTDSGQGPLVGLPLAVGASVGGFDLQAMRIPVALVAALAVPVLWLLGRLVVGTGPAFLAAVLLATSPAFLFYGRTATLVGISLLPLLLNALTLARVLDPRDEGGWRWSREGVLAATLLFGIYAYAPVRLFWPLTVLLLLFAAWRQPARRGVLLPTALLCLLIVPLSVMALERLTVPNPQPVDAALGYFHARGEQLAAMSDDPAAAGQYVRNYEEAASGASGWDAALSLIGQNTRDLVYLLLDRDTLPVPTDYWNERGRFWPWFFLPFAAIGALMAVARALRGGPAAALRLLPLAATLGLALPLLLTSRVHIGRLLPALPFALLLTAAGVWLLSGWLARIAYRAGGGSAFSTRLIGSMLAAALLLPVVIGTRVEMATLLSPTRESRAATAMIAWSGDARERDGAVLVEDPDLGDEIERVHAATYRLDLDREYRFVDLQEDAPPGTADTRPPLYWHGALAALRTGAIEEPCSRLWFVGLDIAEEFFDTWRDTGCGGAPDSVVLP